MSRAHGFEYALCGDDVVISHHGKKATTLRGDAAVRFLEAVESNDPQLLMAKATGNYKRGNERSASNHPRNRRR